MSTNNSLLALVKANVQWQMDVGHLLQQGSHRWLEAAQQISADSLLRTRAQTDEMVHADSGEALLALPSQAVAGAIQDLAGARGTLTNAAIQNHMDFTSGLQQAWRDWQQAVAAASHASAAPWPDQPEPWRFSWLWPGAEAADTTTE